MKIIIDIPHDAFKYIKDNRKLGWIGDYELAEVIANGTPLKEKQTATAEIIHLEKEQAYYQGIEDGQKMQLKDIQKNRISS